MAELGLSEQWHILQLLQCLELRYVHFTKVLCTQKCLISQALMSGGIPGFVDVVMNFGSSAMTSDNLMTQLLHQNRKLVFYGDDTWMRLFPKHFIRSEGITSFFVADYTEVSSSLASNACTSASIRRWMTM